MSDQRWSAWDLAEAFHLAHAADYLAATDVLDDTESSADAISTRAAVDPILMAGLLNFLADRTDIVVRGDRGFRRGPGLNRPGRAVIDQYLGAYGPNACSLSTIMVDASSGRAAVNRQRHARAYTEVSGPGEALLPDIVQKLGLDAILDLGCGAGGLLIEMARRDKTFRGTGIDANADMIRIAEQRRRSSDIGQHAVEFIVGDVSDPSTAIPEAVLQHTKTVVAANLLNEFFMAGGQSVVAWLQSLRGVLPDAILVVADYYGVLGHGHNPPRYRALHDWIQLVSSQGIPPPDLAQWEALYREAGCCLAHSIEDRRAGIFVHLVRLTE
ncbi:MAG TPA: methyltransferase domain-containing protein [Mycobacterium sp.]|nr:methyltransferase domain-containing protein [Mycobacterium sp.]